MNAFATGHVLAAAKAFFCRNMLHFFIDVAIIKHDVNLLSLNRRFAAFEDMDLTYLEVRICLATQAEWRSIPNIRR